MAAQPILHLATSSMLLHASCLKPSEPPSQSSLVLRAQVGRQNILEDKPFRIWHPCLLAFLSQAMSIPLKYSGLLELLRYHAMQFVVPSLVL